MGMISEFKEFVAKGNMIDMAVGIIVGAAFGKIVSSLVNDVVMPPLGVLIGGVDFTKLSIVLQEAVGKTEAVTLNYGNFLQTMFEFLIIAFVIFMMVKGINSLKRKEEEKEEEEPAPSKEEVLLTEIRDALRGR